jgi:hypothetical protein
VFPACIAVNILRSYFVVNLREVGAIDIDWRRPRLEYVVFRISMSVITRKFHRMNVSELVRSLTILNLASMLIRGKFSITSHGDAELIFNAVQIAETVSLAFRWNKWPLCGYRWILHFGRLLVTKSVRD